MTAAAAAAIVRRLRGLEPYQCSRIDTGHGYDRTVYGGCGNAGHPRDAWWVVRPGDTGPRWTGLDDTLAELTRYRTEAAWVATIPADDPMFPA